MNCLIIDDEPIAVNVIKAHLEKIPFVNIVGKTTSAFEAIEIIMNLADQYPNIEKDFEEKGVKIKTQFSRSGTRLN